MVDLTAMLLSICVPTIPGRESLLSRCLWSITEQPAHVEAVEILVVEGDGPLGDKVNAAVKQATGRWVTIVDDDDWLAGCYVSEVTDALESDPDYVGLTVVEMSSGSFSALSRTSGASKTWRGPARLPVPKGVTRTSIAETVHFGNEYASDRQWAAGVAAQVETWVDIDRGLYFYDFWRDASAFLGSGQRDVGWWPFDESNISRITVNRGAS